MGQSRAPASWRTWASVFSVAAVTQPDLLFREHRFWLSVRTVARRSHCRACWHNLSIQEANLIITSTGASASTRFHEAFSCAPYNSRHLLAYEALMLFPLLYGILRLAIWIIRFLFLFGTILLLCLLFIRWYHSVHWTVDRRTTGFAPHLASWHWTAMSSPSRWRSFFGRIDHFEFGNASH